MPANQTQLGPNLLTSARIIVNECLAQNSLNALDLARIASYLVKNLFKVNLSLRCPIRPISTNPSVASRSTEWDGRTRTAAAAAVRRFGRTNLWGNIFGQTMRRAYKLSNLLSTQLVLGLFAQSGRACLVRLHRPTHHHHRQCLQ